VIVRSTRFKLLDVLTALPRELHRPPVAGYIAHLERFRFTGETLRGDDIFHFDIYDDELAQAVTAALVAMELS
jgi:hypothetical protein